MNRATRLEQRIKKIQELRAQGMDDATIRALIECEEYERKVRNSIDWWDILQLAIFVVPFLSMIIGVTTGAKWAWMIVIWFFIIGFVVWIFKVFFGALGILGGIARWAGKQ